MLNSSEYETSNAHINLGPSNTFWVRVYIVFGLMGNFGKFPFLRRETGKHCLGPVFPAIYDFGAIQFSDTHMSDGYFHIFLRDESN